MPATGSASSSGQAGTNGDKSDISNSQHANPEPTSRNHNETSQNEKSKQTLWIKVKVLWAKLDIDLRTFENMVKGALAPTIAIAAYQSTAWARTFTTLGYIVGIAAALSMVILPRTKFLQTMLINVVAVGLACAVSLLSMYCTVRARTNSGGYDGYGHGGPGTSGLAATGAETAGYNSSASAVAGVWLFVQIYAISVFRAQGQQYTVPGILAAIFSNIASVYSPQFSTMQQAISFAYRLLAAFYTGFAIAVPISLVVFPLTSRQVVFTSMTAFVKALQAALTANVTYMHSLEETDMFAAQKTNTRGEKAPRSPEAEAFKAKMRALAAVQGKLQADVPFAKREIAMGKLGPDDIQELFRCMRAITIPAVGLSCMPDVFELIAERIGWDRTLSVVGLSSNSTIDEKMKMRIETVNEWHDLMKLLREPFGQISQMINDGLEHVLIVLRFVPDPRPSKQGNGDIEADGSGPKPGDLEYTNFFDIQSKAFLKTKETMLRGWCHLHGVELPDDYFVDPDHNGFQGPEWLHEGFLSSTHQALRRQLFLFLYIEFLLFNTARRTHQLMMVADGFCNSGKLQRNRVVVPGYKRLRKWFYSIFDGNQGTDGHDERDTDGPTTTICLGDAYKRKSDPDHLPPANAWERFSNQFRRISHFLVSPASAFGLRCACATMSIAVISYLEPTQSFFTTQRLFWAQIMTSISMSPSAGQSLYNFILRILGTTSALLTSWVVWYITGEQTAGILVFLFISLLAGPYIIMKYPRYIPVSMIGQITIILIIGYELQVRKVGLEVATSNGQAYYPIYELGPIRLATVCGGLLVAWIWTIFPYPISEHQQMRKTLGQSLYLLANYYSVMHETIHSRLRDTIGDMTSKNSPGRKLEKARLKVYAKANVALQALRMQSSFLKYDIPIGGRFPSAQYQRLTEQIQALLNFMSLVSIASSTFGDMLTAGGEERNQRWLASFRKLVGEANITSQQITTLLSLLSASVSAGTPLPPYLKVPEAYLLEQKLDELDKDLLNIKHIAEPGYASFAVMQVGTKCIIDDMKRVIAGIKELVGELDFSYHIVSTANASRNESGETLVYAKSNGVADDGRTKMD